MSWHGVPQGITNPPPRLPADTEHDHVSVRGTVVLVIVFLASFALYYFANWKLLSGLWRIG